MRKFPWAIFLNLATIVAFGVVTAGVLHRLDEQDRTFRSTVRDLRVGNDDLRNDWRREIYLVNRGINDLVKPAPLIGNPIWARDSKGKAVYSREVRVSSPIVLEGMLVKIKANGVEEIRVVAVSDPASKVRGLKEEDGWKRVYIQHPFGIYRIEVVMVAQSAVSFEASF